VGKWYRVTKTIKGHQYIYEQQTYRDGKSVRTRNRYVGPAGSRGSTTTGSGGQSAVTTTSAGLLRGAGDFAKAILNQFDAKRWGIAAAAQLGLSIPKKRSRKRRTKQVTTTTRRRYAARRNRKTTWFIKDHNQKRAIGDIDGKRKIFLGVIDGKKYFSIGRQSKYWEQRPPADEVWDYE
jgi:hypothetical protein